MRARGLKHRQSFESRANTLSRPMRARGLKPFLVITIYLVLVAPHAGAWVETALISP